MRSPHREGRSSAGAGGSSADPFLPAATAPSSAQQTRSPQPRNLPAAYLKIPPEYRIPIACFVVWFAAYLYLDKTSSTVSDLLRWVYDFFDLVASVVLAVLQYLPPHQREILLEFAREVWAAMPSLGPAGTVSNGNPNCWIQGFNYELCCDPSYGVGGNPQCWDSFHNYEHCCHP